MVRYLSGLQLGDVENVKISNCRVPVNPVKHWLTAMGIEKLEGVKWLQFSNAVPSSQSQFEGIYR